MTFSWIRALQSTMHPTLSSESRAFLPMAGSRLPFSCGGRVTHRTLTPCLIFSSNRSRSTATRRAVTKPEKITTDSLALEISAATATSKPSPSNKRKLPEFINLIQGGPSLAHQFVFDKKAPQPRVSAGALRRLRGSLTQQDPKIGRGKLIRLAARRQFDRADVETC